MTTAALALLTLVLAADPAVVMEPAVGVEPAAARVVVDQVAALLEAATGAPVPVVPCADAACAAPPGAEPVVFVRVLGGVVGMRAVLRAAGGGRGAAADLPVEPASWRAPLDAALRELLGPEVMDRRSSSVVPYVAAGSAVALAGTSIGFYLASASARDALAAEGRPSHDNVALVDARDQRFVIANVLGAAAIALGAAALVAWALEP